MLLIIKESLVEVPPGGIIATFNFHPQAWKSNYYVVLISNLWRKKNGSAGIWTNVLLFFSRALYRLQFGTKLYFIFSVSWFTQVGISSHNSINLYSFDSYINLLHAKVPWQEGLFILHACSNPCNSIVQISRIYNKYYA